MPTARPMIEVTGLKKAFGALEVLKGVNLVVPEGSTYVLLGESGSGKTVLLRHLDGLLQPDAGRVVVDGRDLATLDARGLEALRHELGIQFQGSALFDSMSVAENVAFPMRELGHLPRAVVAERVTKTLRLLGLEDARDQLPGELSGGMKKRVGFARAMALEPKILLSDEPAAGLDPLTTRAVEDTIVAARRTLGATAFVITYSLSTAFRIADRLGFLHDGRIVAEGPPEAFRHHPHPALQRFLHEWLAREEALREVA